MKLLALETSGRIAGAAVVSEEGVLAELSVLAPRSHAEHLHPAIAAVCELSSVSLRDLDGVAADVGPGLFTGIRVGVAAAKAVALARGIPCVAVTSLGALSAAASAAGASGTVVPVVDLRRGEVAWEFGGSVSSGKPEELLAAADGHPGVVFAGDGALRYEELLASDGRFAVAPGLESPPVSMLGLLARDDLRTGGGLAPAELAPLYLREADARINWTTRHDAPGRRGGPGGTP